MKLILLVMLIVFFPICVTSEATPQTENNNGRFDGFDETDETKEDPDIKALRIGLMIFIIAYTISRIKLHKIKEELHELDESDGKKLQNNQFFMWIDVFVIAFIWSYIPILF